MPFISPVSLLAPIAAFLKRWPRRTDTVVETAASDNATDGR